MIPVNSVLQVGYFPDLMQAEIYRRFAQWALAAGGALWLVSLPLSWM